MKSLTVPETAALKSSGGMHTKQKRSPNKSEASGAGAVLHVLQHLRSACPQLKIQLRNVIASFQFCSEFGWNKQRCSRAAECERVRESDQEKHAKTGNIVHTGTRHVPRNAMFAVGPPRARPKCTARLGSATLQDVLSQWLSIFMQ